MKVLCLTGIKSDYDILYPVLKELNNSDHDVSLVVSGAHLSEYHHNTYKRIIENGFKVEDRIDTLFSTDRTIQRSKAVGLLINGFTQSVERLRPDFIIVLGDREESIAAAIVGNYMEILVVHLAGGDPVYGNADDPMRFAVSKLAHVHCCFAKHHVKNLIKVGEESFRIFNTGNPSFTNIHNTPVIQKKELKKILGIENDNFIVIIKHPMSSEFNEADKQMEITFNAVETFCFENNFQAVWIPSNSDPGSIAMKNIANEQIGKSWLIKAKTLPMKQFINLIRYSKVLVGNSSMGLLEAPYYKLPVVNIGNRQKGRLNAGNVDFVGYKEEKIIELIKKAALDESYRLNVSALKNPYGDENSAKKVKDVLESVELGDKKWYVKKKVC